MIGIGCCPGKRIIFQKLKGIAVVVIFLTGCTASNPGSPAIEAPTPADWQDRIRECISSTSFLVALLPGLNKYTSSTTVEVTTTITPTSRGCITLPGDIYPVDQRTFSSEGTAYLGYVSNWEQVCGGAHTAPLPGDCTGEGYEAGSTGMVTMVADSSSANVPQFIVHFVMGKETTP